MVPTCLLLSLAPWPPNLLITCAPRFRRWTRIILTTSPPSVVIQNFPPLFSCSVKQILLPITTPHNDLPRYPTWNVTMSAYHVVKRGYDVPLFCLLVYQGTDSSIVLF